MSGVLRGECLLLAKLQTAHFYEVLGDFGDTLLAFVNREVRPICELLVYLFAPKVSAIGIECKIQHAYLFQGF